MRILLIILFALPFSSFGQGFGGGLYGGISTTQVSGDGIVGFNKAGGWAGAFTDYRFTPRSTIQFEISFIQKGSRQAGTVKNNNTFILYNHNMLEIPILYRWYGIKNMSIEFGPQVGILLSSIEKGSDPSFVEVRNSPAYRKAEFSGAAGLSYYFWKGKIEVNVRYSNSILTMRKNGWWMNHVFAFSVRYWFKTTLDRDKIEATKKKNQIEVKLE
ncbi:MAG: PorT family protein [Flavobacteriales bacterium]|nr:PorT family protein [Flavobacteriales bacterium]